jgi:hypothetical protein
MVKRDWLEEWVLTTPKNQERGDAANCHPSAEELSRHVRELVSAVPWGHYANDLLKISAGEKEQVVANCDHLAHGFSSPTACGLSAFPIWLRQTECGKQKI